MGPRIAWPACCYAAVEPHVFAGRQARLRRGRPAGRECLRHLLMRRKGSRGSTRQVLRRLQSAATASSREAGKQARHWRRKEAQETEAQRGQRPTTSAEGSAFVACLPWWLFCCYCCSAQASRRWGWPFCCARPTPPCSFSFTSPCADWWDWCCFSAFFLGLDGCLQGLPPPCVLALPTYAGARRNNEPETYKNLSEPTARHRLHYRTLVSASPTLKKRADPVIRTVGTTVARRLQSGQRRRGVVLPDSNLP